MHPTKVNPGSPLVINIHELGRRPGNQHTTLVSAPAPADLGTDIIGVPEGSVVETELLLEAVMEGVLATGTARVTVTGECVRCLDPLQRRIEAEFRELFVYPESEAEEDEAYRLEGDLLDLEPVVRNAVVLGLPFQPICREDCPGLCPRCGVRLADDPEHDHDSEIDPRWAALAQLRGDDDGTATRDADPYTHDAGSTGRMKE